MDVKKHIKKKNREYEAKINESKKLIG